MEFWIYDQSKNVPQTLQLEGDEFIIGRDPGCAIRLTGSFVAHRHARIYRKGNQFFVENICRSGLRVANRDCLPGQPIRLDFGDEIQIAQYAVAMLRAGQQALATDDERALQKRLIAFEQQAHAELLERMNLRVTGHLNKNDPVYIRQILQHLDQLLDRRAA